MVVESCRMTGNTSLLERMISRLIAQRACLDQAVQLIKPLRGCVIELGLGKARTYDHLRRLLPEREILVFDREVHAPEAYLPDRTNLYLGEFQDTLPRLINRLRGRVALLHADIGSRDHARDQQLVKDIAPLVVALMRARGIVVTDREMYHTRLYQLTVPREVGDWKYYMYKVKEVNL